MADQELIKTTDLNLASTLLCLGFDIIGMNSVNKNSVSFFFKKTFQLQDVIDNYWRGKLIVNPLEFSNVRRDLLSRMRQNEDFKEYQPSEH